MTPEFYIEISCHTDDSTNPEVLERHLEDVADHLADLNGIVDADLGADLGERRVDFSMTVEASSELEAVSLAYAAVRTAIHAANGATPGWEALFQRVDHTIEDQRCIPA